MDLHYSLIKDTSWNKLITWAQVLGFGAFFMYGSYFMFDIAKA